MHDETGERIYTSVAYGKYLSSCWDPNKYGSIVLISKTAQYTCNLVLDRKKKKIILL